MNESILQFNVVLRDCFYSRAAASLTELFVVVLLVGETFFQFLVLFIFLLGRQFSNLVNYQPRSGRSADDAFVH